MTNTSAPAKTMLDHLAVECVHFDDQDRPIQRKVVPLLALMRSLTVTLPVSTTFNADRPGAI